MEKEEQKRHYIGFLGACSYFRTVRWSSKFEFECAFDGSTVFIVAGPVLGYVLALSTMDIDAIFYGV